MAALIGQVGLALSWLLKLGFYTQHSGSFVSKQTFVLIQHVDVLGASLSKNTNQFIEFEATHAKLIQCIEFKATNSGH